MVLISLLGWGTDEKALISVLAHRNAGQLKQIWEAYKDMYNEDLIKQLKYSEEFRIGLAKKDDGQLVAGWTRGRRDPHRDIIDGTYQRRGSRAKDVNPLVILVLVREEKGVGWVAV
ncbi:hypothetical protein Droror1_Dr00026947 [Drosera rotundifolia]